MQSDDIAHMSQQAHAPKAAPAPNLRRLEAEYHIAQLTKTNRQSRSLCTVQTSAVKKINMSVYTKTF